MEISLEKLRTYNLIYLATPYSKYRYGLAGAFEEACKIVGKLIKEKVHVYSPIAHTHPVALHANLDPLDHNIWLPFDKVMMDAADLLLIATMEGWDNSKGILHEVDYFFNHKKDIKFIDPTSLELTEFKWKTE